MLTPGHRFLRILIQLVTHSPRNFHNLFGDGHKSHIYFLTVSRVEVAPRLNTLLMICNLIHDCLFVRLFKSLSDLARYLPSNKFRRLRLACQKAV